MNATERPVLLCGLGRVGRRVLEVLRAANIPVSVVSLNDLPDDPGLQRIPFVKGDSRNAKNLEAAGIHQAHAVVIVTSDDLANVSTAILVRKLNPECRIVVRMFNQNLLTRLGSILHNITALSVSALAAPLLAVSALTGDSLAVVKLDSGVQQIVEVTVYAGSPLAFRTIADITKAFQLRVIVYRPWQGSAKWLHELSDDITLSPGDRIVVCAGPKEMETIQSHHRQSGWNDVLWAGRLRRFGRTLYRTLSRAVREVDLSVRVGTVALFLTFLISTLIFRYGVGTNWADGIYNTVSVTSTETDLHGDGQPAWVKVFLSLLKLAGAALVAGFTAILTQYFLRAKLGGVLEVRRIPERGHIVVCGLGNVGFRCVEELVRMNRPVVAIELVADNPFAETVRRMGVPVIVGDATVEEVLRQARAETTRAVIAATDSELVNLEVALLVKGANPERSVVVRLDDADFADAIRQAANIQLALSVPTLVAPAFVAALYGDRVHALFSIRGRALAVVELTVQENDPELEGVLLVEAMREYAFLPLGVFDRPAFAGQGIPSEYRLASGDRIMAVIEPMNLERLLRRDGAGRT